MQKYANYLKEREGMDLIESNEGFVVYTVYNDINTLYIAEIFVEKEYRGSLAAYRLYQKCIKAAKENYCDRILGTVDISTVGYELSERLMKRLKFEFQKKQGNLIFYELRLIKL